MDERSKNGKVNDKLTKDDQKRSTELDVDLGKLSLKAEGSELTDKPAAQSGELSESDKAAAEQSAFGQEDEGNLSLTTEGSEPLENPAVRSEDLSESDIDVFVKHFKQRRKQLGFTQAAVGLALGKTFGNIYTDQTISNFENRRIPTSNMRKLQPILQNWLEKMEREQKEQKKNQNN